MTPTTRRALLRTGCPGARLSLRCSWRPRSTPRRRPGATSTPAAASAALRRKTFRLEGRGPALAGEADRGREPAPRKQEGPARFSLTFRSGSAGPEQGSYVLRRPGFRPTTLFVVPSDATRRTYEAVVFRKP